MALGLHLLDCEFRLCLWYWLGIQMFEEGAQCPVCHMVADPLGDHQVSCGGNGDHIFRHNALCDAVFSAAQSVALAPQKEMPSLIPNSQCRPADVFLPSWKGGHPAALDMTVMSTMQQATIHAGCCLHPRSCPDGWRGKETSCSWGRLPGSWCPFYPTGFGDTWGDECFSSRHTGLPRASCGSTFGDPPC